MDYIFFSILILSVLYSVWVWAVQIERHIKIPTLIFGQLYTLFVKIAFLILQIKGLYFIAPLMMIAVSIQFLYDFKYVNLVYLKYKTHDINETGILDFIFALIKILNIIILAVYAYIAIGNLYVNYGKVFYETQQYNYLITFKDLFVIGLTYSIHYFYVVKNNSYTLFAYCYQYCYILTIITSIVPHILKSIDSIVKTKNDE